MSDIVERLRKRHEAEHRLDYDMLEAADEIERLRQLVDDPYSEITRLREQLEARDHLLDERLRQRDDRQQEIERLRALLREGGRRAGLRAGAGRARKSGDDRRLHRPARDDEGEADQMSDIMRDNLCWFDPRYDGPHDEDDGPPRQPGCACDNCFYGRDPMALEVERLRGLLRPFAALDQPHNAHKADDHPLFAINSAAITCGDVRRVREALGE